MTGVWSWYLVIFSLLLASIASEDAFDRADTNGNGLIERQEFVKWSSQLEQAMQPFLSKEDSKITKNHNDPVLPSNERIVDDEKDNNKDRLKRVRAKVNKFWGGFVSGIVTIWATEVGDKTFFIAAILSMKHDRIVVFAGAIGALIVMTVLSVLLGGVAGYFLPPSLTHYAGAVLFVVFGCKMLHDSREMSGTGPSDELNEVEEELSGKKTETETATMEAGNPAPLLSVSDGMVKIFSQAFFLTFLAEWGDRSQIATITLSAAKDAFGVTLGAVLGHSMCTGLAVVGGKFLASRISEKTVTIVGGVLFLLFAVHSFVIGPVEE